jgi:polyhydroxyalkanoate synthase
VQRINAVGYCIGGTLLVMTLAYLAAKGDPRFGASTFMVSMQDYAKVGETALFMGEPAIDFIEQQMMERGYLDSREMANMFSLLRSNDLIWANVVNNYLLGNPSPPSICSTGTATAPAWPGRRTAGICATPTSRTT